MPTHMPGAVSVADWHDHRAAHPCCHEQLEAWAAAEIGSLDRITRFDRSGSTVIATAIDEPWHLDESGFSVADHPELHHLATSPPCWPSGFATTRNHP